MLNSYKDVVPLREVDGEHKLGNHVL
jgi:hypothetical protein